MKNKTLLAALGASAFLAAASNSASAALLFGFNAFSDTSGSETAEFGLFKNTSTVTKSAASSSILGSSDGYYGASQWSAGTGNSGPPAGSGGNGYLNISGTPTIFSITNNTGNIYELESLLFDYSRAVTASTPSGGVNATFDVEFDDGSGPTPLVSQNILNAQTTTNLAADYRDAEFFDVGGLILNPGDTFSFLFTGNQSLMVIDNIALTGFAIGGIPEPANFAALGGLLISGLAIRSRRRSSSKA